MKSRLIVDHRFHKECLAEYFEGKIGERKVGDKDVCCAKPMKNISPKRYPEYEGLAA